MLASSLNELTTVSNSAAVGRTQVIHEAVKQGDVRLVKSVIEKNTSNQKRLLEAKDLVGVTPVVAAAILNKPDIVAYLVSLHVNLNASSINGNTALHFTSLKGFLRVAQVLLEAHDDDAEPADVDSVNVSGDSPLMFACRCGHFKIVEMLLAHGADRNRSNRAGLTPLMLACLAGHGLTCLILFVRSKDEEEVDVNAVAKDGRTALHFAVQSGDPSLVDLLCLLGVDMHARASHGLTALEVAREEGLESIVSVLERRWKFLQKRAEIAQRELLTGPEEEAADSKIDQAMKAVVQHDLVDTIIARMMPLLVDQDAREMFDQEGTPKDWMKKLFFAADGRASPLLSSLMEAALIEGHIEGLEEKEKAKESQPAPKTKRKAQEKDKKATPKPATETATANSKEEGLDDNQLALKHAATKLQRAAKKLEQSRERDKASHARIVQLEQSLQATKQSLKESEIAKNKAMREREESRKCRSADLERFKGELRGLRDTAEENRQSLLRVVNDLKKKVETGVSTISSQNQKITTLENQLAAAIRAKVAADITQSSSPSVQPEAKEETAESAPPVATVAEPSPSLFDLSANLLTSKECEELRDLDLRCEHLAGHDLGELSIDQLRMLRRVTSRVGVLLQESLEDSQQAVIRKMLSQ